MDKKYYTTPEIDVMTAYAHLMDNAVNDGNISAYVHTSQGTITYDPDQDKSEGGDEAIVDAKTGWSDYWGETWNSGGYDPWAY